jgi:hypothetical protein
MRQNAAPSPQQLLALVATVTMAGLAGGCAQILGYDGLSARENDASVDTGADTTADVIVADVADVADTADVAPTGPDVPPLRPVGLPAQASGKGKTLTFAVKRLYLGTQTHLGEFASTAWREWGYDLDGVCTDLNSSKQSIGTCKRVDTSTADVLVDGDRCRDNNFGAQIMGLVTTFNTNVESNTTASILNGSGTIGIVIDDVDEGVDDGFAPGMVYSLDSLPKAATPTWDGTDVRKVTDDSVQNLDIKQPRVSFPHGYIRGNVWVSGDGQAFNLPFGLGGTALVLPLQAGRFTVPLDAAHEKSPSQSVVVGAIALSDLEAAMKPVAASAGLCPGNPLYDGLITKMLTFPDVVVGAPNLQDTTKSCDGLSVGLGFDLAPIQPLTQIVPAAATTSKCP